MYVPFDVWFAKRNPDACLGCFGEGRIQFRGRWTGQIYSVECSLCDGTGKKPAEQYEQEAKRVSHCCTCVECIEQRVQEQGGE